jgi:Rad3-related DNA helicase
LHAHPGNYLAFLPSYAIVKEVAKALVPLVGTNAKVVRQRPGMPERERDRFVAEFRETRSADTSLIGLCVLGGIFGESIDLPGESLVGVVVLGTGMPRATGEREVIRNHFDARGGTGFAYAYTYPGMIKVLQAAGRLIRTEEDRGVVLLLDDRFLEGELQKAFPTEWKNVRTCTLKTLSALLAKP